jgi:hypothetical protein
MTRAAPTASHRVRRRRRRRRTQAAAGERRDSAGTSASLAGGESLRLHAAVVTPAKGAYNASVPRLGSIGHSREQFPTCQRRDVHDEAVSISRSPADRWPCIRDDRANNQRVRRPQAPVRPRQIHRLWTINAAPDGPTTGPAERNGSYVLKLTVGYCVNPRHQAARAFLNAVSRSPVRTVAHDDPLEFTRSPTRTAARS